MYIFVAVYYFLRYNIHGWMVEQQGAISDCTNTHNSKQVPQGIWVSSVLPPSLFPAFCSSSWMHVTAAWCLLKEKHDESQDESVKQHLTRIWQPKVITLLKGYYSSCHCFCGENYSEQKSSFGSSSTVRDVGNWSSGFYLCRPYFSDQYQLY